MSNVNTNAPAPAQPSAASYATTALQLFAIETRSASTPTYDPTKRPKDWADATLTGAPNDTVTYDFIDTSSPGAPVAGTISMSVAEAAALNLPGIEQYAAYFVQPTSATESLGTSTVAANPANLSTIDQANALAVAWGLSPAAVSEITLAGVSWNWGNETRRNYQISYNGGLVNVGQSLSLMNGAGVGAPGEWILASSGPVWKSLLPTVAPAVTLAPWPEPVRALLPNEALFGGGETGLFGGGCVVYRTDMPSPYNPATAAATSGGGLTSDQAAQLLRIDANLQALMTAERLTPKVN